MMKHKLFGLSAGAAGSILALWLGGWWAWTGFLIVLIVLYLVLRIWMWRSLL